MKKINLSQKKKNTKPKYNIILDIDETLIHSEFANNSNKLKIILRPNLRIFLSYCYTYFNVGYWTIGTFDYCHHILLKILTKEQLRKTNLIISRKTPTNDSDYYETIKKHTFKVNKIDNIYTKPLLYLFKYNQYNKTFKSNNTIIIDNNPYITGINPNNSILIPSFYDNKNDKFLLELMKWLDEIKYCHKNIKKIEKPDFFNHLINI